jgi:sulfur-carrier protein
MHGLNTKYSILSTQYYYKILNAMKLKIYAALKQHFNAEFDLPVQACTLPELKNELLKINPEAARILELSRFAINDVFVSSDHQFAGNETISIIPPSSGG